jgi:hypothetical protein
MKLNLSLADSNGLLKNPLGDFFQPLRQNRILPKQGCAGRGALALKSQDIPTEDAV